MLVDWAMRTFVCVSVFLFIVFCFFYASAWDRKLAKVLICIPYTPTPDYMLQRTLLPHIHKSKALASDTTKR